MVTGPSKHKDTIILVDFNLLQFRDTIWNRYQLSGWTRIYSNGTGSVSHSVGHHGFFFFFFFSGHGFSMCPGVDSFFIWVTFDLLMWEVSVSFGQWICSITVDFVRLSIGLLSFAVCSLSLVGYILCRRLIHMSSGSVWLVCDLV